MPFGSNFGRSNFAYHEDPSFVSKSERHWYRQVTPLFNDFIINERPT